MFSANFYSTGCAWMALQLRWRLQVRYGSAVAGFRNTIATMTFEAIGVFP